MYVNYNLNYFKTMPQWKSVTFASTMSSKPKDYIWSETFHSYFLQWEAATNSFEVKWGWKIKLLNVIYLLHLSNVLQKCCKSNILYRNVISIKFPMLWYLFLDKLCLLLPSCEQINKLHGQFFCVNRWTFVPLGSLLACRNGATNTNVR